VHDLEVGFFVATAHVINLAHAPGGEHAADGAAVVLHVEPVAHLQAVAVDGQRRAGQRLDDEQRNQFFGEVVGTVVVGAVGGEHRQAVAVVPGAHQVIAGGLAGAVGAVGLVGVLLGEGWLTGLEAAIDLVGAYVQEAKGGLLGRGQRRPVAAHGLEQLVGALHIGLDEGARAVQRAIDVAFGGEVEHGARPALGQQALHQGSVADAAVHELVPRIGLQAGEVFEVAGVGEQVEVDDRLVALGQPVEHEVAADESGTAGDKDGHVGGLRGAIKTDE